MILYFNKNGQLLEKLEYGSSPRAGTTKFQIFAYFADLQPNDGDYDNYSVAMIRLRRPDIEGSEYPDLFMTTSSITFDSSIETSKNNTFQNGTTYYGFVFDFSKIKNIQEDAFIKLLDISGMWRATITLMNRNSGNYVTGLVQFNVEGSVNDADEEPQQLEYEVIQQNIADLLQSYALKTWVQNNYVPYTGATNDVNLGSHALKAGTVSVYYNGTTYCGGFGTGSQGNLYIESNNAIILEAPHCYVGSASTNNEIATRGWVGQGYVTTDTVQTITGQKTFTGGVYVDQQDNSYLTIGSNYSKGHLVIWDGADGAKITLEAKTTFDNQTLYIPDEATGRTLATQEWVESQGYLTEHQSLAGYVEKTNQPNKIYGVNNAGNQTTFGYSADASQLIVSRDIGGRFQAEEPSADKDVANKKYVDDRIGDIEAILDALDIGTGV